MKLPASSKAQRQAFTLVELMIVIAIITLLVGLLMGAAMRVFGRGKQVVNTNDIQQLSAAITNFQQNFNVTGIPSRIHLLSQCNYTNSQIDTDSVHFLQKMWPKANFVGGSSGFTPFTWDGTTSTTVDIYLEGEECLVFFLGGIPFRDPNNGVKSVTGFSTKPADPTFHVKQMNANSSPGTVVGPFFEFQNDRLIDLGQASGGTARNFYAYLDNYRKVPYAYFSAYGCYGAANGYNRYYDAKNNPKSDCPSLGGGNFWPYAQSSGTGPAGFSYLSPSSFQIICAGADFTFGQGTAPGTTNFWTPQSAQQYASQVSPPAADDQCNFYGHLLGDTP